MTVNNFNEEMMDKLNIYCNYSDIFELYNILISSNIEKSITDNLSFLINLIPEIQYMIGFLHKHPHHHLDVWEHTLYALSLSFDNFDLRLTLLLHDIGKPFSFTEENGIRHFYNHPYVSYKISKIILTRLGFNKIYIDKICYLIRFHDSFITKKDINKNYDLSLMRYYIQECDALAHHPDKLEKRKKYLENTKKLLLNNDYL